MRNLSDIVDTSGLRGSQRLEMAPGEVRSFEMVYFREREGNWGKYWVVELRDRDNGHYFYLTSNSRPFREVMERLRDKIGEGVVEPPINVTLKRVGRLVFIY
jgi:hypothetical protein